MVAAPVPGAAVRRRQQGVGLGAGQIGHDCPVVTALGGIAKTCLGVGSVRDQRQRIAVEGVDRGQPGVAGRRAVASFVVEVGEERPTITASRSSIVRRDGASSSSGGEHQQELDGVPVGGDGLRAGLALPDQPFGEEALEQGCHGWRGHDAGSVVGEPARASRR